MGLICYTCFTIFLAVLNNPAEAAKDFKVGGKLGWRQPPLNTTEMYSQWAASKRFRVGDSLVFEYRNDSVLVVDKWDYYHCNTSEPITAFNNGKSIIKLDSPGPFYFISGNPDHCKNGQRLLVDVMSPHPPPSIASPPKQMAPMPSSSPGSGASVTAVLGWVWPPLAAMFVAMLYFPPKSHMAC